MRLDANGSSHLSRAAIMAEVDGNTIMYHYLQKDLRVRNYPMFLSRVIQEVSDLGIWIHPDDYCKLPILLPFTYRDINCRKKTSGEKKDSWGAPNLNTGLQKDDNTLIKNFGQHKKHTIESSTVSNYAGKSIGKGFKASHVWREIDEEGSLASRNNLLFSFCPNLVWLPPELAKLSDREGSVVQSYLQLISTHIYRDVEVSDALKPFVEKSWQLLENKPINVNLGKESLPKLDNISYLRIDKGQIELRLKRIIDLGVALSNHGRGLEFENPKISSKYDHLVSSINRDEAKKLGDWLQEYHRACQT